LSSTSPIAPSGHRGHAIDIERREHADQVVAGCIVMNISALACAAVAVAAAALPLTASAQGAAPGATLSGFALLPANTFTDGPTSGQFAGPGAGGNALPLVNQQPVQGFSGVLAGPAPGSFLVLADNGFGTKTNSADALLRMYAVRPDFRTAGGGTGTVSAADFGSGAARASFDAASRITFADPARRLGFALVADGVNYYTSSIPVDPAIRSGRLLTGADLDPESVRRDKNGHFWFGDEFGPFLVKTDGAGTVLRGEVALPGVQSPQSPYLGSGTANLGSSRGFEGLAVNAAGDRLYTLLEGTVAGDAAGTLRIDEFDVDAGRYTGARWRYKLETEGTAIGDMTAVDATRFLVIERNGATATSGGTPFKKIYLIDLGRVDADGIVAKTEVVDLMNIADPNDLNGDGSTSFTFPFVTIENVLLLDDRTLLVVNDNNYPGTGGRNLLSDDTEFLLLTLANPVPEPGALGLMAAGLALLGAAARPRRGR
jgi:hypothetical protein